MELSKAKAIADNVVQLLAPLCLRIQIAGSVRREKPEVKDIELVLIRKPSELINFTQTVDRWKKVKGDPWGRYTQRLLPEGIALDIFMVHENNFGLQLAIRTGSSDYSHKVLATGWVKKGYKSEGGMLTREDGTVARIVREEEDLFELIGIPYVEPHKREVKPY